MDRYLYYLPIPYLFIVISDHPNPQEALQKCATSVSKSDTGGPDLDAATTVVAVHLHGTCVRISHALGLGWKKSR